MRLGGILLVLALGLSLTSSASLDRPQRPPLIWKWLSGDLTDDKEPMVADDRIDTGENSQETSVKNTTKQASLEELADLGFRLTGVYISPESILNPVRWVTLFRDLLPSSQVIYCHQPCIFSCFQASAATRQGVSLNVELGTGEPYASEAIGGLADKEYGKTHVLYASVRTNVSLFRNGKHSGMHCHRPYEEWHGPVLRVQQRHVPQQRHDDGL